MLGTEYVLSKLRPLKKQREFCLWGCLQPALKVMGSVLRDCSLLICGAPHWVKSETNQKEIKPEAAHHGDQLFYLRSGELLLHVPWSSCEAPMRAAPSPLQEGCRGPGRRSPNAKTNKPLTCHHCCPSLLNSPSLTSSLVSSLHPQHSSPFSYSLPACYCGVGSIPALGTFRCHRHGQKKAKHHLPE